ncbi:MAG: tRNA (cytidine(34)-2'-O)-methyltransferase [Helicobacteraceae bacterium]|nr:tRNA (cytidine(34)-2'-O)-methyltransferase [Helicobacteraceae bacterium]
MINIVLVNPQIPNNTGTIGRLCVNTGSTLHLIKPLGFDIDEKAVRRAGLDYWEKLELHVYENLDEFFATHKNHDRFFFATTKTDTPYFEQKFQEGDFLFLGSETEGLPAELLERFSVQQMTIPMTKEGRSLNLAISTGIVLYEAIKQNFTPYKELM